MTLTRTSLPLATTQLQKVTVGLIQTRKIQDREERLEFIEI